MSYLLHGQDSLSLDERVAELRAQLDPGSFSTSVIDVQSSSLPEIAAACQATPFFGGRRVVVLLNPIGSTRKAAPDGEAEEDAGGRIRWPELAPALERVPESTTLIVRHDGALAQTHFLVKAARKYGWAVESFPIPRGDELLDWVSRRARALDVAIAPDAAIALLDLLHSTSWRGGSRYDTDVPNPRQISSELDKLACAATDGVISVGLVQELVVDRAGYTAFTLNDRTFGGRTEEALVELTNVLEAGEPEERIIAQLASEAAALAGAGVAREYGPGPVAAAAGSTEGRVINLQKKTRIGREGLRSIAEAVRDSDARVKSGLAQDASATVVPLVAGIAEAARAGQKPERRRG